AFGSSLSTSSRSSRWHASATFKNSRKSNHGLCESQRRCPQICSSNHISASGRSAFRGGGSSALGSSMTELHHIVGWVSQSVEVQESEGKHTRVIYPFGLPPLRECGE